jgi:outer membrane receptor protein involved in Fe transport
LGNDDQNALRLGIEKGDWFFNIGNSFRKPNLYEKFGDGYVEGNEELEPEKGVGIELGYGVLSVFMYDFEEAIEYVPGYFTDVITTTLELDPELSVNADGTYGGCVLDPNYTKPDMAPSSWPIGCVYTLVDDNNPVYTMPTYANTGEYTTAGMRYANNFGPVFVMLKYTDTDQTRVPKFAGVLQYSEDFFDVNFRLKYAFNLDREPGPYDVLAEGQEYLEDLNKLNLYITKEFTNGLTVSFKAENITDEVVEVIPFYNSEGREIYLTLGYKW